MTFVSFCNNSIQYHSYEVFKMYLINVWKQTIHVILYSVVVFTLTFWVRDLGSIPLQHNFVFFWKNNQTLRAKITLFPRKDLHLNLPKWSTNTTCSFKPKKFTVGHFDLDRNSCLRKIHTVKSDWGVFFSGRMPAKKSFASWFLPPQFLNTIKISQTYISSKVKMAYREFFWLKLTSAICRSFW